MAKVTKNLPPSKKAEAFITFKQRQQQLAIHSLNREIFDDERFSKQIRDQVSSSCRCGVELRVTEENKLLRTKSCKRRFCLRCVQAQAVARDLSFFPSIFKIEQANLADNTNDPKMWFVTLTVTTCDYHELAERIAHLNRMWRKMYNWLQKKHKGYVNALRKFEVNANKIHKVKCAVDYRDFKYHVHLHVLIQGQNNAYDLKKLWLNMHQKEYQVADLLWRNDRHDRLVERRKIAFDQKQALREAARARILSDKSTMKKKRIDIYQSLGCESLKDVLKLVYKAKELDKNGGRLAKNLAFLIEEMKGEYASNEFFESTWGLLDAMLLPSKPETPADKPPKFTMLDALCALEITDIERLYEVIESYSSPVHVKTRARDNSRKMYKREKWFVRELKRYEDDFPSQQDVNNYTFKYPRAAIGGQDVRPFLSEKKYTSKDGRELVKNTLAELLKYLSKPVAKTGELRADSAFASAFVYIHDHLRRRQTIASCGTIKQSGNFEANISAEGKLVVEPTPILTSAIDNCSELMQQRLIRHFQGDGTTPSRELSNTFWKYVNGLYVSEVGELLCEEEEVKAINPKKYAKMMRDPVTKEGSVALNKADKRRRDEHRREHAYLGFKNQQHKK